MKAKCLFFLGVMSLVVPAMAIDGAATMLLSLPEAELLWREHNREVKLAKVAVTGAEADVIVAGQAPNPQVSMNVLSISPGEGFGGGNLREKKMDSILRLEQLIERGGKRELRSQTASARLEASQHDLNDTLRQQRIVFWSAYYDLMLAQEKQRTTEESAELYSRSLRASEIRYRVGDISQNDLSRLKVEKLRAENEARMAVAELARARTALAYLIGREAQANALQSTDLWPDLDTPVGPTVTMAEIAQRPDIKAAQARLVAAEVARDLARSLKTRDVTIGVQMEHNLQNAPRNSYGFGVSMPLFVRYGYEGEIARAEAELQQAREQMDRVVALALGDTEHARSQLASSADRRQRLESELLADAERVAKAAEFAYVKGAIGLMDLLDARRTWRQVQLEAAQARADYAKARAAWRMLIAWEKQ